MSARRKTAEFFALNGSSCKSELNNSRRSVRFELASIQDILERYLTGENIKDYQQLVCSIRDNLFDDKELCTLLEEATQCVTMLNHDLRLFVEAILVLKWAHRSSSVVKAYKSFLVNVLCAHNYHTKFALDRLILCFTSVDCLNEWDDGMPSKEEFKMFKNIHSVIEILLKTIPMSRALLYQFFLKHYPYIKKSTHQHETYIHNLLWILEYQPELKMDILSLIFNRLIILDVNASKSDILEAEQNELEEETVFSCDSTKTRHPIAHTLDVCLDKMFNFILSECYDLQTQQLNWDNTKQCFQTMLSVFDKLILPTYNIHHVQFVMFFLCSLKSTLSEAFLSYLWKKVCDINVASVHRQTAVAYIASLVARAGFIPLSVLMSMMEQMANWIHSYSVTQDGLECLNSDVRVHAVFYSVCQALFYIVCFRYRDFVHSRKRLSFLETLNLGKMVTSRLNPLRVCQPAVVHNFAAITRMYQLAYCYTVIEHNARNTIPTVYMDETGGITTSAALLDSFFPFDPFLLKRTYKKISSNYLEYKDSELNTQKIEEVLDDDDFLNDQSMDTSRHSNKKFSYSSSPGFKYKS